MTIRIVTDSTCDLPQEIVDRYGITVIPLYIHFGNQSYLDGIGLSREEFYARLPNSNPLPTTAVPGPSYFVEVYERLAAQGATAILSIHIAASLSGVVDVARLAAREAPVPVTVLDSATLTLGVGFLVWAAAEAVAEGCSLDEVLARVAEYGTRTHVFAALDTLEFLRRSGRVNALVAALGGWLKLKPVLLMHQGEASGMRVRTTERAHRRLVSLLQERQPLERVALVHTHALRQAEQLMQHAAHLLPRDGLICVDLNPVFGVHLGPGAVGFACVSARVR
ncbi:MAG: DegV family protein [Anaerolineae bacterium]|nr:DegV family protein [Anaerolineae bacterium]